MRTFHGSWWHDPQVWIALFVSILIVVGPTRIYRWFMKRWRTKTPLRAAPSRPTRPAIAEVQRPITVDYETPRLTAIPARHQTPDDRREELRG